MKKLIAVSDNYTGSEAIADVEELGRGAFYECSAQRIILPDTLKKLDDYALYSPGKVTKIIIPSKIQGVAGLATSLTELIKGDGNK